MPLSPTSGQVRAQAEGSTVTILLSGKLDGVAGRALLDTLRTELDRAPARIDIDLSGVIGFTDGGACALVECRSLSSGLSNGLHYRTEGGAGQGALLAAFTEEPM
jgi:hypothetical protein